MLAFPPDATFLVQLISFFALLVILNKLLFAPFAAVLAERERRTSGARAEAASNRTEADELARTVDRGLEEARARAAVEAEGIRREAREREAEVFNHAKAEAATRLKQLREAIAREREQAKSALREEAKTLAQSMVDAVLRSPSER
jgi:F-type H+-transporting ATPase subunit b